MRKSVLRRPSPALVVAFVALVVALGGTSYAAFSLPKNSVGSKQIKNGAVTNSKLKKGAVTTGKIKNGTVTKSKINTSGLTVPNALHANSADSATNATNATNAANVTGVQHFRTTLAPSGSDLSSAAQVTLFTDGPLSLVGKCWTAAGAINAEVDLRSSVAGHWSSYDNSSDSNNSPGNVLSPGTDEQANETDAIATPSQHDFQGPYDGSYAAIADDGSAYFTGIASVGANLNSNGLCTFAGGNFPS
jgi:hypothetical protein